MSPEQNADLAEPAGIAQLLDEHHLVVVNDVPAARASFTSAMTTHLEAIPGVHVVPIDGSCVQTVADFTEALERALIPRHAAPGVDGARGDVRVAIDLLRRAPAAARHRYFIWTDADVLLDADRDAFGRLANALFAIAAECEHLTPDHLVIQRTILIGGPRLAAYGDDDRGAFRRWMLEDGATSFWEVASCVTRPPVLMYRATG